jgi:pilus assembly protein CpaF
MFEFLKFAVEKHKNIMVAGGTAAGKTTLLNVMSSFIPSDERILTIEDSAELQLQQPHIISLETRPTTSDQAMNVDIRLLVKNALRMRPDRIIVGECRGAEALDMLQAMNTGHDGSLTTGHANSALDMLTRLETMVMMAGMEIPLYAIREQVARALDVVVFVQRFPDGVRRISEVIEVVGMVDERYDAHEVFRFNYQIGEDGAIKGSFDPTGYIPEFMREIKERGGDVPLEIFSPQPVF